MDIRDLITPWPLYERRELTNKLTRTPQFGPSYTQRFQGVLTDFPVYRVPIGMPVYRLANGRTLASQQEYVAKQAKADDFFTHDPESEEALMAQHAILREMVRLNKEDMLKYFREHEQTEPLMLTQEGYVVNGNRRLCTMRLLLAENEVKFARFEHVRVIVLPPCNEADIDVLEAELQIQPDIKAEYSWIDTAMLLSNRQQAHNWSIKELSRVHQLTESDVRLFIDLLDYADQYLAYKNKPHQYSEVLDLKYAFQELQKARGKFDTEQERDLFTQLAYIEMDKPGQAGRRLYEVIPDLQKHFTEVATAIRDQLVKEDPVASSEMPESSPESQASQLKSPESQAGQLADIDNGYTAGELDLLGADVEPEDGAPALELNSVLSAVNDEDKHDEIRDVVQDVLEAARAQERIKKGKDASLKQITAAHTSLATAFSQMTRESNLAGIDTQLDGVDAFVGRIRERLAELRANDHH